jgi:hypothetical protein
VGLCGPPRIATAAAAVGHTSARESCVERAISAAGCVTLGRNGQTFALGNVKDASTDCLTFEPWPAHQASRDFPPCTSQNCIHPDAICCGCLDARSSGRDAVHSVPQHFPKWSTARCLPGRGHAVPQWLSHYATSRKVVGSRPDEVNGFFPNYLILLTAPGPGVHSASNRNEYQKQENNLNYWGVHP